MLPLYHDPWFTFRFAEDRIVPRFHLEGAPRGSQVSIIKIDPESGRRLDLLTTATVGDGGWVDVPQPILVRAGEAFIAVAAHQLTMTLLPDTFAICRLGVTDDIPAWATAGGFFSITRTADELSIVCLQSLIPDGIRRDADWRCFKLVGPIPFTTVGVLVTLVQPLAEAGISVFAVSTFDTDCLLVKEVDFPQTTSILRQHGHSIH
jgi:hypothetical protein